jgi:demethylmenaquinone methyltransferase/2-methoxy-6-polyprenyl-1,4-benzoquinol methylase
MLRVTKPGGKLVICEFSQVQTPVIKQVYNFYLSRLLPLISKLSSKAPAAYTYLGDSILAWPNQQALAKQVADAGWTNVTFQNQTFGVVAIHSATKGKA